MSENITHVIEEVRSEVSARHDATPATILQLPRELVEELRSFCEADCDQLTMEIEADHGAFWDLDFEPSAGSNS